VGYADTQHVRLFLDEYGSRALGGLVLHTGPETAWIASGVLAVPWWRVF